MTGAGDLDQRITIETATTVRGASGADVPGWLYDCEPWAKVVETPGREFLKGDIEAEGKAVFKIRYRPVATSSRVLWRGVAYDIEAVTGTRREAWTYLHCRTLREEA